MAQPRLPRRPRPYLNMLPPASGPLASLEEWLFDWLVRKAPFQLPPKSIDAIVKYSPWITLILAILFFPPTLVLVGLGSVIGAAVPLFGVYVGPFYWLAMLLLVAQEIVMFVSVPMLLKHRRNGWLLLFYAELANGLSNIVGGHAINGLISLVIFLYILFQIRQRYVN